MVEVLKQTQFGPLSISKQVMILYAGANGFLDDIAVSAIRKFEKEFFEYMEAKSPQLGLLIERQKELTPEIEAKLGEALTQFKSSFKVSI